MTRLIALVVPALLAMTACDPTPDSECPGGTDRCSGRELQSCYADEAFGKTYWHTRQTCPPSQVCRLADTSLDVLANGCYAPNAYCQEGSIQCGSIDNLMDPVLWTCALQSSDQTIRWSKTDCSAQVPTAICLKVSTPAACYEVVQQCPASDIHCEGNVLFTCSAFPTIIDNRAVYDWLTVDCALGSQVCRVVPQVGPTCTPP